MAEIIDLEKETLKPINENEFRNLLKRFGGNIWRTDWALDTEGNILMVACLDGRHFIGNVTSAFERIHHLPDR